MTKMLLATLAPIRRDWNVLASAKFLRASVVRPHHGLADAITPGQISFTVDAGQMLRSDGVAKAIAKQAPSFDRITHARLSFPSITRGLQLHGRSFWICKSSASVCAALPSPASCFACRHCDC